MLDKIESIIYRVDRFVRDAIPRINQTVQSHIDKIFTWIRHFRHGYQPIREIETERQ